MIGDHPDIANALRTGYPHGEPKYPHCPICGKECSDIYMDEGGDIVACDNCVIQKSAWEVEQCF